MGHKDNLPKLQLLDDGVQVHLLILGG
jgi:hypothetical protein